MKIVEIVIEGRGYYLDTLLKWIRAISRLEGMPSIVVVEREKAGPPRVWACGRLLFEGLPDSEWALLELLYPCITT